ncbi:MAG TPA: IS3 family transposase [Bacteroidales bacterium]|nr:IS3 family transposase [Bacteroidales bacterium]
MKRQFISDFERQVAKTELCQWLSVSRSTCYYQSSGGKRGAKPTSHTPMQNGELVSNQAVVSALISDVFSQEFNRYGYQLSTEELRAMGYIINPKKTYRLMAENGLLLERLPRNKIARQWVKWRKIEHVSPLEHLCMDIKYVYIHQARRNAYLLAIMDVATRFVVGWSLRFTMKHTDVILCLHGVLQGFEAKHIMLRTDNGSQFIAHGLRNFCRENGITQEFTHVATPEENSYVESLFSLVDREVIQSYEFESLYHARDVFERYFNWHNHHRRRHALGRKSPAEYWNTVFHCHPVKPPSALSGGFVKGDDTFKKQKNKSSLVLPLTKPERRLSLLNQDDNENVLNRFEKSVQEIGG